MVGSYLKNNFLTQTNSEELQFYRLLQFLSFVRSYSELGKKEILNDQLYITLQFQLVDFMKTLQVNINTYQRKQFLQFFDDLMGLPPYFVKFSDQKFRKLLFFPVVNAIQQTKNGPWHIKIAVAESLMKNYYPFQLPKSFLISTYKNDLRLKVRLIKSLAVSEREKTLNLEEFFNRINLPNNQLIQIKKSLIQLLSELVENKIIQNEVKIILKSGQKKDRLIKDVTTSDITRRIKYLKFTENIKN